MKRRRSEDANLRPVHMRVRIPPPGPLSWGHSRRGRRRVVSAGVRVRVPLSSPKWARRSKAGSLVCTQEMRVRVPPGPPRSPGAVVQRKDPRLSSGRRGIDTRQRHQVLLRTPRGRGRLITDPSRVQLPGPLPRTTRSTEGQRSYKPHIEVRFLGRAPTLSTVSVA